jgi:hypothetical protein
MLDTSPYLEHTKRVRQTDTETDKMSIQDLATGNAFTRWNTMEAKLAGELVEINVWGENSFDIYCTTELAALRLYKKWRENAKLKRIDVRESTNLGKWALTVELNAESE